MKTSDRGRWAELAVVAVVAALTSPAAQAGLVVNSFDPHLTGSTLINFEGLGQFGTRSRFNVGDVQFGTGCNSAFCGLYGETYIEVSPYSAAGYSYAGSALHTRSGPDRIHAGLNNGHTMDAFGFELYSAESGFTMDVVDDLGAVTTLTIAPQAHPYSGYYGWAMTDPDRSISEVRIYNSQWTWMLMDNFRYTTWTAPVVTPPADPPPVNPPPGGQVPEPSSLLLAALALPLALRSVRSARRG